MVEEKHKNDRISTWWRNLQEKCETLHNQLQDCRVKFLVQDENDQVTDFQTSSLPLDHLAEPEDQINLLLAEVFNPVVDIFLLGTFSFCHIILLKQHFASYVSFITSFLYRKCYQELLFFNKIWHKPGPSNTHF